MHLALCQAFQVSKETSRDFPGSPVSETLPSNAGALGGCVGLIPDQGAGIPHALQPGSQGMEQEQCCNEFNKDFKNGPHQKKKRIMLL